MLRLVLGEVATIVTTGQRVLPSKPLELGYVFKYPHLADALRAIFTAPPALAPAVAHHHPAGAGAHH
jgi:NAD dependent epimerase/dehydratase family enzyme